MTPESFTRKLAVVENRKVFGTGLITAHLILAEACTYLGRHDQARKHAAEISGIAPGFSLADISKLNFYSDPSQIGIRLEVMRKAGLK